MSVNPQKKSGLAKCAAKLSLVVLASVEHRCMHAGITKWSVCVPRKEALQRRLRGTKPVWLGKASGISSSFRRLSF